MEESSTSHLQKVNLYKKVRSYVLSMDVFFFTFGTEEGDPAVNVTESAKPYLSWSIVTLRISLINFEKKRHATNYCYRYCLFAYHCLVVVPSLSRSKGDSKSFSRAMRLSNGSTLYCSSCYNCLLQHWLYYLSCARTAIKSMYSLGISAAVIFLPVFSTFALHSLKLIIAKI